jgi:hypothetical protein
MLRRIQARLTYANVTATVALFLPLGGSAVAAKNLIDGGLAANSVGATSFLAGSWSELPSCGSAAAPCEASLPASGTGFFGSINNSANDQLSPNVTIVARDLSVHVDIAPGSGKTRTFLLNSRADPSHSLRCDISGSDTTCNSGDQTLTIPPGSSLFLDAANFGSAPMTRVQFGWLAIAQ